MSALIGPARFVSPGWSDYQLLDSGDGRKYEQVGAYRFIRPEAQALWRPAQSDWDAHGEFVGGSDDEGGGRWRLDKAFPETWPIDWQGIRFWANCTPFRHLAFFPDQASQWAWMRARLTPDAEVLNLFGYTGVASLVAAQAGARVTHVDASHKAISAAVDNQSLSGLNDAPIRWMADDALKFVSREVRRERRYQGILIDPPKFGRGPKHEIWRFEEHLPELLRQCSQIIADGPAFVILTAYAIRFSCLALGEALGDAMGGQGGSIETGELVLQDQAGRLLPTAIVARWSR
jgi:23S rRNA (cytosine1962-C5)-methyltransferase